MNYHEECIKSTFKCIDCGSNEVCGMSSSVEYEDGRFGKLCDNCLSDYYKEDK